MTPRHFLSIENHSTWMISQDSGFLLLGVSDDNGEFAATLCRGDYIVTYIKDKGFVDIRCVTGDRLVPLTNAAIYGECFPHAIETKPIAVIHSEQRILPERFADRLEFADKNDDWKNSGKVLHLLTQEDGLLLVSLIVAISKAERVAPTYSRLICTDQKQVISF
ncbi:MAG: hypothetical protein V4568_12855 [Pseudomonadota bacterium]